MGVGLIKKNYNREDYWPPKITKELITLEGQFTWGKLHCQVGKKTEKKTGTENHTKHKNIQQGLGKEKLF